MLAFRHSTNSWSLRRSTGVSRLVILIEILCLFSLAKAADLRTFQPIFQQDDKVVRRYKGEEMRKHMNLTANPCHDFYEYACGNWEPTQRKRSDDEKLDLAVITPTAKLNHKITADLRHMLVENVTLDDSAIETKMKFFYKTCLNAERNGLEQQAYFSEVIKNNSGFPAVPGAKWLENYENSFNWAEVIGQLHFSYDMNILIGINVDVNPIMRRYKSLYITQPSTTIPAHLCHAEATQKWNTSNAVYEPILQEVSDNLQNWLSLSGREAHSIAASIVNFEYELCTAMQPNELLKDLVETGQKYLRRTLISFTEQFNNSIDFDGFITKSFGVRITLPVVMTSKDYFHQLIKTLSNHNTTTIANYIMYRALSQLSLPRDDRPGYCLDLVKKYFPKILGNMYKRKYVSSEDTAYISKMYDSLRTHFYKRSLHSEWITYNHRGKNNSYIDIRYPTYGDMAVHLELNNRNYWPNLGRVLAYNRQEQLNLVLNSTLARPKDEIEAYDTRIKGRTQRNYIEMGLGIVQAPFYAEEYPNAMRYATIGQKLATELVTIYDQTLWGDENGHTRTWDAQTINEYEMRRECFRRQISNYLYNNPNIYENATTVRRLIATSGGLNVAFNVYLTWLDHLSPKYELTKLSKETLTELNFTNTQLFFIAFAQMHCRRTVGQNTKQQQRSRILSPLTTHSMERYQVNGPLRNFVEFAREFRCSAGSEMHTADKCVLY